MPYIPSERNLARRFARINRDSASRGQIAWVGNPDGITVSVPGTTNQVYIRLINDPNRTHPAYNLTGIVFVMDDMVWCELRTAGNLKRGDYWIVGEYTLTP